MNVSLNYQFIKLFYKVEKLLLTVNFIFIKKKYSRYNKIMNLNNLIKLLILKLIDFLAGVNTAIMSLPV